MTCIVNRIGVLAVVLLGWCVPLAASAEGGQPAAAHAAGEAPSSAEERARQAYMEAVQDYEQRRYKDAIDGFERADELAPDPAFSFNIGIAYEDMGDAAGALRHYRTYLRRAPSASDRDEVEVRIEKLQSTLVKKGVQQITVYSEPSGATLSIDGEPRGVTPWTGEITPGHHALLLTKRGYRDQRRKIVLPAQRALDVELSLPPKARRQPAAVKAQSESELKDGADADLVRHVEPITWGVLGAAAISFGTAVGFEVSRAALERDAREQDVQIEAARRLDRARSREAWAKGFTLLGAGLSLTGVVLGYRDIERGLEQRFRAGAGCTSDGCALWYGTRF